MEPATAGARTQRRQAMRGGRQQHASLSAPCVRASVRASMRAQSQQYQSRGKSSAASRSTAAAPCSRAPSRSSAAASRRAPRPPATLRPTDDVAADRRRPRHAPGPRWLCTERRDGRLLALHGMSGTGPSGNCLSGSGPRWERAAHRRPVLEERLGRERCEPLRLSTGRISVPVNLIRISVPINLNRISVPINLNRISVPINRCML